MMTVLLPGEDPRPVPPVRPDNSECCNSGCNPCVFDLYQEQLDAYHIAVREWEKRQEARKNGSRPPR